MPIYKNFFKEPYNCKKIAIKLFEFKLESECINKH